MNKLTKLLITSVVMIALSLSLVFSQDADSVTIIVNKGNSVESINAVDLKNIYLGKKTLWDDGKKIILYDQKSDNKAKSAFLKLLNMTEVKFKQFWMKILLSGKGVAPKALVSDAEVIKSVSEKPEAIGYISTSSLNDSVKALTIKQE